MLQIRTQLGTFGRLGPELSQKLRAHDVPTALVKMPRVPTCPPSRAAVFQWTDASVHWLDVAFEVECEGVHYLFNITQPEARSFLHRVVDTGTFPIVCCDVEQARGSRFVLLDECLTIHEALWQTEDAAEACTPESTRVFQRMCSSFAQEFAAGDEDSVWHTFVVMQPHRMHHRAALGALKALHAAPAY